MANGAYKSRRLGLTNSKRVLSAQSIVGQYNNDPFLTGQTIKYGGKGGLVGGGNVALDVARLLLNYNHESLVQSDISHLFRSNLLPTTEGTIFIFLFQN